MASDGTRARVDRELVRRGLVPSREEAQRVVAERRVQVDGAPVRKPSTLVRPSQHLVVGGPPPRFVSRGGEKLQGALEAFALDVTGALVLDAGISTGGFTDCVLQAGAATVIGIDVGYGQLAERLRRDPRVELHERTNVRLLDDELLAGRRPDLLVADLSFISLTTVLPVLLPLLHAEASALVLIKPQFEVGLERVGKGGIVRDPDGWRLALERVLAAACGEGWRAQGVVVSSIRGAEGNVEFLALLRRDADASAGEAPGQDGTVGTGRMAGGVLGCEDAARVAIERAVLSVTGDADGDADGDVDGDVAEGEAG
jgi:23S rRNA (cytidine1920-2'-O)/16S rRNA (cytidine1409-2'-O)-methyltransferase